MKSYATPFAIAGALLIAALLVATNLITTPAVLWCVPPIILLMLWPAGVYFCSRKRHVAFSITGSVLIIGSLAALNWLTLPQPQWYFYAAPLILCWPAGVLLKERMFKLPFALLMSAFIALYCLALNFWLTPHVFWAIHSIFVALWWPMSLYFSGKRSFKAFSIAGALLTIVYLVGCNLLSTAYPWALFACFPVIWWPLSMFFGKRLGAFKFSIVASLAALAWYGALNLFLAPGSPWIIFIAFALLWWPLSVSFYGRYRPDIYAVVMTLLSIAFFAAVNLIYSPGAIWAFYPAFALLWWPLSVIFHGWHRPDIYAIVMSLLSIAFFAVINFLYTPGVVWAIFPAFGLLWWPLSVAHNWRRPDTHAVVMTLLSIAFFTVVNVLYTPGVVWAIFPEFAMLWWPLSVIFHGWHRPDTYAVVMTLLSIAFFTLVNVLYTPGVVWAFYPAFVMLWWPLSVLFHGKHRADIYAVVMSLLSIAFFAVINILYTPGVVWAFYPAFGLLWWPVSMLFARKKAWRVYSVVASLMIIGFLAAINLLTSPKFLWFIFPALFLLWWPLAALFKNKQKHIGFALAGAALLIGTLAVINLMTAPGFLWFVFPALGILWWPAAVFFAQHKSPLGFSIAGCLLVAALVVSLNLITSPGFPWCAFPIFGILWWPLGVFFHGRRRLKES